MFKIGDILQFLPHRYPFLLVDRVLEMEKSQSITALKNVTYNEPFFQGHFPSLKVMPGVLIVEALAQAGGILLYHSTDEPEKKIVFLSKIDNARFRRPVVPGDQLILHAQLVKLKERFCQIHGVARVGGAVAVEADFLATLLYLEEAHGLV